MTSPDLPFTKITEDGLEVVITWDGLLWDVEVDGQRSVYGFIDRLAEPEGEITHVIRGTGGDRLGLSAEEAAKLESAKLALELSTPAGRRKVLVRQRDRAVRDWHHARQYLAEGRYTVSDVSAATAMLDEAIDTVISFDANNPGIRTREQREEDEDVLRFVREERRR
ncbi:hypothetical protein GCM10022254_07000 [Actinomadura meridiana]|uniref:Uncharacterized protein n=1 Tax=Actinomadura meridiana TaxID=559626 RepID=A0ABP8BTA0_9ACTN